MFKKIGSIVISLLLLVVITGVTVNMHYCGSHLYSLKIYLQPDKCCNNNQCGHCKDKSIIIKVHDDFLPVFNDNKLSQIIPLQLFGLLNYAFKAEPDFLNVHNTFALDVSPPGMKKSLSLLQTYLL